MKTMSTAVAIGTALIVGVLSGAAATGIPS